MGKRDVCHCFSLDPRITIAQFLWNCNRLLRPSRSPYEPGPRHLISAPTEKWPVASAHFSGNTPFSKSEGRKKSRSTWHSPWHCITHADERSWKCPRDLFPRISFLPDKWGFFRGQTNTGITVLDVVHSLVGRENPFPFPTFALSWQNTTRPQSRNYTLQINTLKYCAIYKIASLDLISAFLI